MSVLLRLVAPLGCGLLQCDGMVSVLLMKEETHTHVLHRVAQICACFFLAAIATLLSHQLIDMLSAGFGNDDAYGSYKHIALGPLLLTVCMLAVFLLGRSIVLCLARRDACDPLTFTSRFMSGISPLRLLMLTCLVATLLLFGIEFYEQIAAFGHVEGLGDALGGNVACGLSMLLATSCAITGLACASARAVLHAIALSCNVVLGLFLLRGHLALTNLYRLKAAFYLFLSTDEPLLASGLGLRAPPLS